MELNEALLQIESALNIAPPLGATELPRHARFRAVLLELKSRICPKRAEIKARMESDGGELAVIIVDTLITALSQIPLPVATVAKRISTIGLDRFCDQPSQLLE
jgi:hypothetical protein